MSRGPVKKQKLETENTEKRLQLMFRERGQWTSNYVNETYRNYPKWNKPNTKECILYDSINVEF